MSHHPKLPVEIPDDLGDVIQQGIDRGKKAADRRRRVRQAAARTACSLVLVLGVFVGGVNVSPAFAAAVENVPILGQLVQIFGRNQAVVEGGSAPDGGTAAVTMERDGDTELMQLRFAREEAALYQAAFASYPKTVTITLPGTAGVEVLSEITRAQDTSQYIKSVYKVPTSTAETTVLQLELESDADVQIEEYRDPGSLVIRLLPTEIRMDTVYSVRTLSVSAQALPDVAGQYAGQSVRILQDDSGKFFVELALYDTRDAALSAASGDLIVEERAGNEVPVCFETMEQYESDRFLDEYYQLLLSASTAEPVISFLNEHLASASSEEQQVLLDGLSGFLQDTDEALDWNQIAGLYRTAGQDVPAYVHPAGYLHFGQNFPPSGIAAPHRLQVIPSFLIVLSSFSFVTFQRQLGQNFPPIGIFVPQFLQTILSLLSCIFLFSLRCCLQLRQ